MPPPETGLRTMRALVCEAWGHYRTLVPSRVPVPALQAGHVRVRIHHATVSFGQTLIIAGTYQRKPPLPFVPGTEVSGVVAEVAPGVTDLAVGDRVAACLDWGGYAEEAVIDAATVYPLPRDFDLAAAATLPLTWGTPWAALHWRGGLAPGKSVLVFGAGGGVGLAAVEIARAAGAKVFAAASSAEKHAAALAHGAHHALPAEPSQLIAAVHELTAGRGVDLVFDPVGGDLFDAALRVTAPEGRILVIGFAGGRIAQAPTNILLVKNIEVIGFNYGLYIGWSPPDSRHRFAPRVKAAMAGIVEACARGGLRPEVAARFPLEGFGDAFDRVTGRHSIGRVVLDLADPDQGLFTQNARASCVNTP